MKGIIAIIGILLSVSCSREPDGRFLVCTLESRLYGQSSAADATGPDTPPVSGIYSIEFSANGSEPVLLTRGFHSAKSPSISYDGKHMLFSGRKSESDKWAVWEMKLKNGKTHLVSSAGADCTDPVYLPGERLAYVMHLAADSLKAEQAIFTGSLKGEEHSRITFNPWSYRDLAVLHDGRLLATGRQSFPETGKEMIVVMRPDGTKAEMFYCPPGVMSTVSRPDETTDGNIIFIESDEGSAKGIVTNISYNRPLHSRKELSGLLNENIIAASASVSGRIVFASLRPGNAGCTLLEYSASEETSIKEFYTTENFIISEIAFIESCKRPRKLPSEVDNGVKSGLILCQDINLTGYAAPEAIKAEPFAVKVEILGLDKSLGIVDAGSDGSVYLKVVSDTPFRMQTLDKDGKIVNGPGAWLYLRPNERRGCVGCHEDQEIAPANRMAEAVRKHPVTIPVAISGIKEKDIELE